MTVFKKKKLEKGKPRSCTCFKKIKNPLQPGHWVMSCALLPPGYQFKCPLHQEEKILFPF